MEAQELLKCPACGSMVRKIRFCTECGAPLPVDHSKSDENSRNDQNSLDNKNNQDDQNSLNNETVQNGGNGVKPMTSVDFPFMPGMMNDSFMIGQEFVNLIDGRDVMLADGIQKQENTTVSDKDLKMLVDFYRATVATVGGDGYTEEVLYERAPGVFEIHTYSKYAHMKTEIHKAYKTSETVVKKVYEAIETMNLSQYVGKNGGFMTGGVHVLKYLDPESAKVIRLTAENLPEGRTSLLYTIRGILTAEICPENEI